MPDLEKSNLRTRPKEPAFVWVLNIILLGMGNVYAAGMSNAGLLVFGFVMQAFLLPGQSNTIALMLRVILYFAFSIKATRDVAAYNAQLSSSVLQTYDAARANQLNNSKLSNSHRQEPVLPNSSADESSNYASDHFETRMKAVERLLSPPTDTLNKLHELSHHLSEREPGAHRSQQNSAPLTLYDELMLARQEAQAAAAAQEVTGVQLPDPRCEPEEPAQCTWDSQSYQSAVYPQPEPVAFEPQKESDSSQDSQNLLPPKFPGSAGADTEVQLASSLNAVSCEPESLGQATTGELAPQVPCEAGVAESLTNNDNTGIVGSNLTCSHCGANRTSDFSFCMNCGHTYELS